MQRQVRVVIAAVAASLLVAACDRGNRGPAPGGETGGERAAAEGAAAGPAYQVETAPPAACRAGEPCTIEVRLTALRGFKVNKEYPFKFVPGATDGVTVEGTPAFTHHGDKAGAMTVTFRAASPGTAQVTGTLKLSVCTPEQCLIEEAPVAVDVPVG